AITTISERTGHWTKMRPPFALFSASEPSRHTRSSVDFITITPGFRFSVHTGGRSERTRASPYFDEFLSKGSAARGDSPPCCSRIASLPAEVGRTLSKHG